MKSLLEDSIIFPLIWPMNHCKGLILALSPVFKYATWFLILLSLVYLKKIQYKTDLKFMGIFASFFFFFLLKHIFLAANMTASYTLELTVSG